ncbi:ParB/Sulfiredoxin [uncultured Caudovirales phage]|uniref:ParB/Sulfiredoxin n=1 Tax=uncultured Caudovirales phage TaxID=2100421 RepID=A0A6J5LFY7_9CAUD|nr:ParB/Sulfiredoxin [uncultured Caudovirales phage]
MAKAKIKQTLTVEHVPIDSVHLDPANVRKHPDRNLAAIKASLARFGQQKPIVIDGDGIVRAGNGTLEAARALGWETIAAVRSTLAGSEATAYAIADNRTAELAAWDYQGLAETIKALEQDEFDISCLGWEDYELEPMLAAEWKPPAVEEMPSNEDGGEKPHTISFSVESWETISQAINTRRSQHGSKKISDEQALELICVDYIDSH